MAGRRPKPSSAAISAAAAARPAPVQPSSVFAVTLQFLMRNNVKIKPARILALLPLGFYGLRRPASKITFRLRFANLAEGTCAGGGAAAGLVEPSPQRGRLSSLSGALRAAIDEKTPSSLVSVGGRRRGARRLAAGRSHLSGSGEGAPLKLNEGSGTKRRRRRRPGLPGHTESSRPRQFSPDEDLWTRSPVGTFPIFVFRS